MIKDERETNLKRAKCDDNDEKNESGVHACLPYLFFCPQFGVAYFDTLLKFLLRSTVLNLSMTVSIKTVARAIISSEP